MAFEIDHDWQGNLSTPRARVGERVKNRLLIILCAVWVCIGLLSHQPWKPNESQTISVVKSMLNGGSLLAPIPVGDTAIDNPPLYYLSAAGFAKALTPILPMHDAARLVSGIWMAFTLILIGMTGRELWGVGVGRQTTFIFLGSLGLIVTAHLLVPDVSALTAIAMAFYGLALAKRRPYRASALLGSGIGIGFLSTGLLPAILILANAIILPILFTAWRSKSYAIVLAVSAAIATPWLLVWPVLCLIYAPDLFMNWWHLSLDSLNKFNHFYFLRTLAWYAWPSLPIALWGLWRYRSTMFSKPKLQLIYTFFLTSFLVIGFAAPSSEVYALPLLLPLAVLAGGSVESLKRGAAGALNWFGLILFGIMGLLIWLGWTAMMSGWPPKLATRMHVLSGLSEASFSMIELLAAIFVTVIWLISINTKRSNRAAITDWALGITMAWSLLMTLWLPFIDAAKSYKPMMMSLSAAMPKKYACINSRDFGNPQQALLDYYTDLRVQPFESMQRLGCDLYLIQDERGNEKIDPGRDWKLIWEGKRAADRRENYRLFQRIN